MRTIALLLRKDLRVLRRSPVLVAAFIMYPLLVATLVGLVVRFAGDRPKVAFVDLDDLPAVFELAGEDFSVANVLDRIDDEVELIPLPPDEADRRLETGRVVAEIIVPQGFIRELRGMTSSPRLLLKTTRSGLAGRAELEMQALVYNLNRLLQETYVSTNLGYIRLLVEGGQGRFAGSDFDFIGLHEAARKLDELRRETDDPELLAEIRELSIFVSEVEIAIDAAGQALRATANPIALETEDRGGRTWLLTAQVQAYAFALTLAFVCILLAAAAIASERDENVIGRLARGLVRLGQLVTAKIALAIVLALSLGVVLVLVFGAILELGNISGGQPWERVPLLVLGLALVGAAFGAFGVVAGVLAREARTAALVAFLIALPLVLIGLLPEETSAVSRWVSNFFPMAHAVRFFESALFDLDPWGRLGREAAWLVGLTAALAAMARIGVRRLLA